MPVIETQRAKTTRRPKAKIYKRPPKALLERLGVTEGSIMLAPDIEGLFATMAAGGLPAVLKSLRFSLDEDIQAFLEKYDEASARDKNAVPLQAWVLSCGIDPHKFIGEALLALRDHSVNQVKVLALTSHPDVMRERIENAKRPDGVKDREAIDLMLGALPSPKGATFITKQYIQSGGSTPVLAEGSADEAEEPGDVDLEYVFPSILATQKKIGSGISTKLLSPLSEEEELRELEAAIDGLARCTHGA